jgi:hypothetical protein
VKVKMQSHEMEIIKFKKRGPLLGGPLIKEGIYMKGGIYSIAIIMP